MFNPSIFENSAPSGHAYLEVVQNEKESGESSHHQFVPLRRTQLNGQITGPLADLQITHTFFYTKKDSRRTLEALYRFPLPGDAAVRAVSVRFGSVQIEAELKARVNAEADYAKAKEEGRQAILTTREGVDVFTLQLAGLKPDEEIVVETRYVQLARQEGKRWSLRIPLTTAPRFTRLDELDTRSADAQPLRRLRDPGHRFALDLQIEPGIEVASSTHTLAIRNAEAAPRLVLSQGEVAPDRDCILTWQTQQSRLTDIFEGGMSLQVATHDDADGYLYFLAQITPPAEETCEQTPEQNLEQTVERLDDQEDRQEDRQDAQSDDEQTLRREVVLLVDHSGSMSGAKWAAADWAVESFLRGLRSDDRFALGVFHTHDYWFDSRIQRATSKTVAEAIDWLQHNIESGGTNLGVALERALSLARGNGDHARRKTAHSLIERNKIARHLLIVTDAAVTDAGRILRLADEEFAQPDHRRISVLCIDAAPNAHLAMELAERGGGIAKFLTSSPAAEDITTALEETLAEWNAPLAADLHIAVDRPSVQSSGRRTLYQDKEGWSAIDLGDLAAGYNRWLVGRTLRGGDQRLTFQLAAGIDADEPLASAAIDLHTRKTNPALKALFGARRINTLEHLATAHCEPEQITEQLARLGYDLAALLNELQGSQQTPKKVYAENRADQTIALMRRLLVKESLHFGLASSEAAFVAVRSEKGAHVDDTVFVANALPAGWSEDFLQSAAPPPLAAGNLIVRQALQTSVMQRSPGGAHPNMSAPASRMVQSVMQTEMQITTASAYQTLVIFSGTPVWAGTESLLFDSRSSPLGAFETLTLSRITVKRYSNNRQNVESQRNGSQAEPQDIDRSIQLLIFIGDLAAPRARIRLADLLRTGTRPLNLTRQRDEVLRVVLWNERGATRSPELPAFELSLQ